MERLDPIIALGLLGAARVVDASSGVKATIELADSVARKVGFLSIRGRDCAQAARRTETVLEQVSRWVPGARCVHRAAAGRVWLAGMGVDSEIVVGVRRDDRWQGHAWLEVDDDGSRLVIFSEEVSFQPVWRRGA